MNLPRAVRTAAVLGVCGLQAACGSIKSKIYDTDNYTSDCRQVKHLKGIPETVDVPTHIKITVTESRYFKGPALKPDGSAAAKAISAVDDVPSTTTAQVQGIQAELTKLQSKGTSDTAADMKAVEALKTVVKQLTGKDAKDLKVAPENTAQVNSLLEEIARLQIQIATTTDTSAADAATIKKLKDELDKVKKQLAKETNYSPTDVHPTRSIRYETITKKELFTVDFKRPAAGVGDLKLTYGKASGGQFFDSVKQEVKDATIQEVGGLVSSVASVLPKLKAIADATTAADAARVKLGLHSVTSDVAVEYFDVHQPNLEGRIQEFLDRNVNACSPPCDGSSRPLPQPTHPAQTSGIGTAVVVPTGGVR